MKVGDLIRTRHPQGVEQKHLAGVLLDFRVGGYGTILFNGHAHPTGIFLGSMEVINESR